MYSCLTKSIFVKIVVQSYDSLKLTWCQMVSRFHTTHICTFMACILLLL